MFFSSGLCLPLDRTVITQLVYDKCWFFVLNFKNQALDEALTILFLEQNIKVMNLGAM